MAAEYLANAVQEVALNAPLTFTASIPCSSGCVYHEDETGIFILRGPKNGQCFATYRVVFNGNVAIPTGGTVGPVAIALAINGEPRPASRAIYTPAAVEEYGNLTSPATIKVPRGCCFTLSVEYVAATTDPAVDIPDAIEVQNANLVISRTA